MPEGESPNQRTQARVRADCSEKPSMPASCLTVLNAPEVIIMHPIAPHWLNFIDGQWTDSEQYLSIHNPGTTDLVATIAQASVADAECALQARRHPERLLGGLVHAVPIGSVRNKSSQAIPWWRSSASMLGSRPRKALNESMAGRLPPASRMAWR